jgi:hypothetical protein
MPSMTTHDLPDIEESTDGDLSSSRLELSLDEWYTVCRLRPEIFAHVYFRHILRVKSSRFHMELYNLIKKIVDSPKSCYVAVAAPRGNAKTQILSVILPLWCVALGIKEFIVLISETSNLAMSNLESIKHELTHNELLLKDFPHLVGQGYRWTRDEIDTANGVKIVALGSGKQVRGRVKRGGIRPDLLCIDDCESDKFVRTKAQRDYLEEWFTKAVLGMEGAGEATGKMDVFVMGTIIHPNSLLSKLLDHKRYPGWETRKYQSVLKFSHSPLWREWEKIFIDHSNPSAKEDAYRFFLEHKDEMLEGTEVLWPEGDPYYNLMVYKITHGSRAFASEKMNTPVDPSTAVFDMSRVVYYDEKDIDRQNLIYYAGVDWASGDAIRRGDLSCIVTVGKDPKTGIIYVIDVYAAEMPPSKTIAILKSLHEIYNYRRVSVELDALKMIRDSIRVEIPNLILTTNDLRIKKNIRIERLEPIISSGTVRIKHNQVGLIEQLELYPKCEHDDILDALELAVRVAGQRPFRLLTY